MIETTLRDMRALKENLRGPNDQSRLDEIERILQSHGEAVK